MEPQSLMSYQWANNLLYSLTGSEAPPPPAAPAERPAQAAREGQRAGGRNRDGAAPRREDGRVPAGFDALWLHAERQVPGWVAISLRMPPHADGPVTFVIQEPAGWHPAPRSQLILDAVTGEVVKWEPFAGQNLGRRMRAWVHPLHTGEAGGLAGQTVAFAASAGGAVLVWTGLALAWRRLRSWRRRAVPAEGLSVARASQEVSAD